MRRSSIITIVLLVLVIIGLTVALVLTNLPDNNESVDNPQVEGEEVVEETPTYIALDSDIATTMATIVYPYDRKEIMYNSNMPNVKFESLTNLQKIEIAYYNLAKEKIYEDEFEGYVKWLNKSDLDAAMQATFGRIDYIPQNFDADIRFEYLESEEKFKSLVGGGGGGPNPIVASGIYKIEEYSDRYEAYAKYLYIDLEDYVSVKNDNNVTIKDGAIWNVKKQMAENSESLGIYKEFKDEEIAGYEQYQSEEELFLNLVVKSFAKTKIELTYLYQGVGLDEKYLSKFFDQASEYKHTFMKNEDGTYYWYQTEKIN